MPYNYTNGRYLVFKGRGSDGAPLGRLHQDGIVRNLQGEPLYYVNTDEHAFSSVDFIFQGGIQKCSGTFYVLGDKVLFTFSEMTVKPQGNETEEEALHREFKKRALSLAGQIVQAKNEMVQARLDMAWSNLNFFRRFRAFLTSRARRERTSAGWRYSGLESAHEFKSESVPISSSSLATMVLWAADARKARADHDYEAVRLHVNSNRGLSSAFWFPPIAVGSIAALAGGPRRNLRWENIQSIYTQRFARTLAN
ncbi:hypothetical protein ACNT2N_23980 [Pseudomonas thivervalensis]|uniref:Uncharacterized protein n=1 Tax=Pseudomonas thivervalensis TaxID=86265 RepID=A0A176NU71_9PSED|nr:hypothetical protein [Pseudomonas thivervalensis]AXA52907.1 hypothetical protein CE140_00580 [Pseudomonas thivervalensis]AXA58625.1 hypothetical protein CEQ51_00580 [Pseudomonas thivervalensis]OAB54678.1 hypothetical protein APS14_17170 [Pseudomonas thivervalensis]SDF25343.1 hypothetical protein SAMN04490204_0114 [Pseudomonas thivervalensis]